ncbi:MAG: hypothetical protein R2856_38730 [Caldilineaceae bacterium]
MTLFRRHRLLALVLVLFVLSPFAVTATRAQFQPHAETLLDAWKLADRARNYRFTSQVTQKTIPAPQTANVGRAVDEDHLTVQGTVDRGDDTLSLSIWDSPATAFDPVNAVDIRIEDGKAQGRLPGGEWTAIDDVTDAFAPGGDVAAYLRAARHVTYLGTDRRQVPGLGEDIISRRYTFAVDADALAQIIGAQIEDEMRRKGELPPGVFLDMGESFRNLVGLGEAWLDADGLPQRMIVDIEFPQQRNGERLFIHVQTDFSDFDRTWLGATTLNTRLHLLAYDLGRIVDAPHLAALLGLLLFFAAAVFLLTHMPARRRQLVVTVFVLFLLMSGELTRIAPLPSAWASGSRSAPQAPGPVAAEQRPQPSPTPEFSSRQSPIGDVAPQAEFVGRAAAADTATDDADRDRLSDADEVTWGTDPNIKDSDDDGITDGGEVLLCQDPTEGTLNNALRDGNVLDPDCANPLVEDTDNDGLTDSQEVLRIGSSPNNVDTDNDGLDDLVEVQGFSHNGEMRYTDPLNPDTDGDGILDGQECPNNVCITTGSGEPDVFEIDNDGDGFIGSFDLSPNQVLGQGSPFNAANPFQLSVNNLMADKSVFVDFQIRPVDPNHIGFAQTVLDWPSGDVEGQVQRRLDTTFADVNTLPAGIVEPVPYAPATGTCA